MAPVVASRAPSPTTPVATASLTAGSAAAHLLGWGAAALLAALTCWRVWRGGRTLNDHAVAALVVAMVGVYPTLWSLSGADHWGLGLSLAVGPVAIYGLFHALDLRRDPGPLWTALARLAQAAMAFSLWTGLTLCFWAPYALLTGDWWPGAWLLGPLGLALLGTAWTYLRHSTLREHRVGTGERALRVVHLSDLHGCPLMTRDDLDAVVARARALAPDLVAVTGDHLMPYSEGDFDFVLDALSRLDVPVVACLGNHDLPVAERLRAGFEARGMHCLVDESRLLVLGDLTVEVAAVNFHWKDARARAAAAIGRMPAPPADRRLLMVHDPRVFDAVPPGRFQLVLAGHTHGGQVGIDVARPWSLLRLFGSYDQGRFEREGTVLWVHRGNWHTGLPPRMGIASEIVLHQLGAP